MAALRLQELVPSAILRNVQLGEWRIDAPAVLPGKNDIAIRVSATDQFDIAILSEKLRSREARFVMIEDYLQNIMFFPDPERYRRVFVPDPKQVADLPGFAPDELVINVRSAEVLDGIPHYPLVPIGFYRDIVQSTGLRPVIMGQIEPSFYCEELIDTFPQARIIRQPGGDPRFRNDPVGAQHRPKRQLILLACRFLVACQRHPPSGNRLLQSRLCPRVDLLSVARSTFPLLSVSTC